MPGAQRRARWLLRVGPPPGFGTGHGEYQRRRTYGAPQIQAALQANGVRCGSRRVARLMRDAGLVGCHRRRRARTTVADPAQAPAPNLVMRDFTAPSPGHRWVGDIT